VIRVIKCCGCEGDERAIFLSTHLRGVDMLPTFSRNLDSWRLDLGRGALIRDDSLLPIIGIGSEYSLKRRWAHAGHWPSQASEECHHRNGCNLGLPSLFTLCVLEV